jgi:hypothetical protein
MRWILKDTKRREEFHFQSCVYLLLALPVAILAGILAGVITILILRRGEPTPPINTRREQDVVAPVGPGLTVPVKHEYPIDLGIEPYRLLGRSREDHDIQQLFEKLGKHSDFFPPERQGRGYCFRDRGVDLVFDNSGLEKLICYAGHPDAHNHRSSVLRLFEIQFGQPRAAVRGFVAEKLGTGFKKGALLDGDCDTWDIVSADFQFSYQLAVDYQGEYPQKVTLVRKDVQRPSSHVGG